MNKQDFLIQLATVVYDALKAGLSQEDLVNALKQQLESEESVLESRRQREKSY